MTYWKKGENRVDLNGKPINVGDILEDPKASDTYPWRYYTCEDDRSSISVRDFNAHNVCICEEVGNVVQLVNLGHYSKNLELLERNGIDPKEYWPEDFRVDGEEE